MMRKKIFVCVLLVVVLLLDRSAFAANVPELRRKASNGDAEAQYQLGYMYLTGKYVGVAQNYKLALRWFDKVAAQNHAGAQCAIGLMYLEGKGVKQDNKEAVKWYRKAAEQGYSEAQFKLGGLYYQGKGVIQNYSQAFSWWSKAAQQDHSGATYNLGASYEMGYGVQQNVQEAINYYKRAVDLGDPDASEDLERLGVSYEQKAKTAQTPKKEPWKYFSDINSLTKAANEGNYYAQSQLGDAYFRGKGVPQDYEQAKYWYKKAAEQNFVDAQYTLGKMYYQGVGTEKDYVQAEYWFTKAAENGDKNASAQLKSIASQAQAQRQTEAKKAEAEESSRQRALAQQQRGQGSKSSKSSKASTSNSAFERIFSDYEANPEVTSKKWEGKTVDVEGILYSVDTQIFDGDVLLILTKPGSDKYGYMFLFNTINLSSMEMHMSALASAKLSIGQKIKLKGQVLKIDKASNGVVCVLFINSEFTQLQAWRCSKCGIIRTKVIEDPELRDITLGSAQCKYGGVHSWQRIK